MNQDVLVDYSRVGFDLVSLHEKDVKIPFARIKENLGELENRDNIPRYGRYFIDTIKFE